MATLHHCTSEMPLSTTASEDSLPALESLLKIQATVAGSLAMMNRGYMACECSHLVAVYFRRDAAQVCTE